VKRLRTLTLGLLTPFYFIRAGSLVSVPSLIAAPFVIIILLIAKIFTKIIGIYPVTRLFGSANGEGIYTTLLMSTGLTFGSISALYGLSHNIIDTSQYSCLIAVVIGSAIVPTVIANMFFLPRHLLHKTKAMQDPVPASSLVTDKNTE
jgi:Kef-type K+ transport system membrane component KefB